MGLARDSRRELDSEKLLFHVGLGSRPRACTRADRTLSAVCSRHDRHGTDWESHERTSPCAQPRRGSHGSPCDPSVHPPTNPHPRLLQKVNCLRSLPCWAPRLSSAPLASWTSLPATSHAGNPRHRRRAQLTTSSTTRLTGTRRTRVTKDAEGDRGVHRTRGNPAASFVSECARPCSF